MNSGIFTIDYVKQRAAMAGKLSRIDIYQGFINPANKGQQLVKVQEIRPLNDRDFGDVWNFFERTTFGDFTAVFFPSREIIPFTNKSENLTLNGNEPMYQNIPTEEQINAQVQKILENERLKFRLQQLEEEREENDKWGERMGVALSMLMERFLGVPGGSIETETETALQGTNTTTDMNPTEQALVILVQKFGEEWLQKFAAKIEKEPHLVNQIKSFFS